MLINNFFKFIIILFIFSCQPIEKIDGVFFDYSQLAKLSFTANDKKVNNLYESKYDDNYIDYTLDIPPYIYLEKWINNNIVIFGNENYLEINVIDSSLKKSEIINNEVKKYKEKIIFLYEISYLVEFVLYDDNKSILASTIVEVSRTTTSGKYISIQESEKIIDYLIFQCLKDFSDKADELLKIHLKNFMI
jgi:hypothetical protein